MQRYFFIIILFIFISNLLKAEYLINDIIVYRNNKFYKDEFMYNNKKQIIEITKQISTDCLEWNNYTLTAIKYTNNKIILKEEYIWKNENWELISTITNNYINDRISHSTDIFNDISIKHKSITEYKYNINQKISSTKYFINDKKQNFSTIIYNYKSDIIDDIELIYYNKTDTFNNATINFYYNDNLLTDIITTETEKNITNKYKTLFSYNNNLKESETQFFYMNDNWEPILKQAFKYDEVNNITEITYFKWNKMFWSNFMKRKYYFDQNNILSENILFPMFNSWKESYNTSYKYNENKYLEHINSSNSFWSDGKDYNLFMQLPNNCIYNYVYGKEVLISYTEQTPTEFIDGNNVITIYPNPSDNGIFYFNTKVPVLLLQIFDTQGHLLLNIDNPSSIINLQNINNGLYIAKFYTNGNILSHKIIINKS